MNRSERRSGFSFGGFTLQNRPFSKTAFFCLAAGLLLFFFLFLEKEQTRYTVRYHTGSKEQISSQVYDFLEPIVYPAPPVRDGYLFTGWYLDEACTQLAGAGFPVESSMELYAGWKPGRR